MPEEQESQYADLLRKLGFKKVYRRQNPGSRVTYSVVRTDTPKPAVPRYVPTIPEGPRFMRMAGIITMTLATDETGQHWCLEGQLLDLTVHGFIDIIAATRPKTLH